MVKLTRRNFIKLGAASGALLATGEAFKSSALAGSVSWTQGCKDFSPETGVERTAIPTACWSCVTRCAAMGYVEDGRLVKMESNCNSIRTEGKMCAKGQAGVNQVYDPDRVLYPMKRVGARGSGQWMRISWADAKQEIVDRLQPLYDNPDDRGKFMFHYGRMKASSGKLIKSNFLKAFGTKTIGNHTSICEASKWTSQELTWGKHYDNWDFDNTNFVLNFGSNCLETHTNHIPVAHRLIRAKVDRGVRIVTFDVRLSNTAAKSNEWIPVKPGTDGAVMLAMCNVIMNQNLHDAAAFKYLRLTADYDAGTSAKIAALKEHLAPFTPVWAAGISGVSASKIESLAAEFATTKPACLITYRGAVTHDNGVENERIAQMLASITGNINNPGGRCMAVGASWKYPKTSQDGGGHKLKDTIDGDGSTPFPTHHMSHRVLSQIKKNYYAGKPTPEVYMWYCYTPVYANGNIQENIDILKDENIMPYNVCSNPFYDESAKYADLILPDATYLERWDWEDMVSPTQVAEYYIRQPVITPLCGVEDFGDVVCELATMLGFPLGTGFDSKEDFVKKSCEKTSEVAAAGGFEYMKANGVLSSSKAPSYDQHKKDIGIDEELILAGYTLDPATKVWWSGSGDYTGTKSAYGKYKGQKLADGTNVAGFKPDKVNKSGYLELYSSLMEAKGLDPLPTYLQIPGHQNLNGNLILTTYKVSVQIHSRSANCKWLTELYHDNAAWIHPDTAGPLGFGDGDMIKIENPAAASPGDNDPSTKNKDIAIKVRVTKAVVPGVVAVSHHLGHWEYGRYASGNVSPDPDPSACPDRPVPPECEDKWWDTYGTHPNWIIPNKGDRISGALCWMDTVVAVTKVY